MTSFLFTRVARPAYVAGRDGISRALFDRRYGVDTHGELSLDALGIAAPGRVGYQPVRYSRLRAVLPAREVTADDVFADLGSGKGRAVLQAALHYRFRTVYGVELSADLHDVAERNLAGVQDRLRCRDVRLVHSDVLEFAVPDDLTVVFLNNPFQGEIFATVLERLLASLDRCPRRLRVVYSNPVEERQLLDTGRFRTVRRAGGWRPGAEWSRSNSYRLYESV